MRKICFIFMLVSLLVACSISRGSDVDKAISDTRTKMDKQIIKCGDSLYFNRTHAGDKEMRYMKFRGKLEKTMEEGKISEADRLNGEQNRIYLCTTLKSGVYYDFKDNQWIDIENQKLVTGSITKENNKFKILIVDDVWTFGDNVFRDNDRALTCADVE